MRSHDGLYVYLTEDNDCRVLIPQPLDNITMVSRRQTLALERCLEKRGHVGLEPPWPRAVPLREHSNVLDLGDAVLLQRVR